MSGDLTEKHAGIPPQLKAEPTPFQAPTPIRVILVDDHEMVRHGLRFLLRENVQLKLVGVAGDGYYALELAAQVRPHVALVDINMPVMDGIELCRRLLADDPSLAVIMLTAVNEARQIEKCIKAGARGYLLKDVDRFRLSGIIRTVTLGGSVIDHRIMSQVAFTGDNHEDRQHDLSVQQLTILKHISDGLSNKEIGMKLSLSENTIKHYVQEILDTIDAKNRSEAAIIALRRGWI
jgi:DNA-binding NarL/FixJ family response regulator